MGGPLSRFWAGRLRACLGQGHRLAMACAAALLLPVQADTPRALLGPSQPSAALPAESARAAADAGHAALRSSDIHPALRSAEASLGLRAQEAQQCLPGELMTWGDGDDRAVARSPLRLIYRHASAPPGFTEAQVLGSVQRAALAWGACGPGAEVISEAAASLPPVAGSVPPQVVIVQWSDLGSRGNFGLANLAQRTLSLGPAGFAVLAARNPRHPAQQTLQMVISHEMGHFFGLMAHSRRCVDVMSYYDNGRGAVCSTRDGGSYKAVAEYRAALPTACDIARCRALNSPQ